jgi:hypothetical protein
MENKGDRKDEIHSSNDSTAQVAGCETGTV